MFLNGVNVALNAALLAYAFLGQEMQLFITFVQAFQLTDLLQTKSNPIFPLIQTSAKIAIAWFGAPDYMNYLAIVWATADIVRYLYHVCRHIPYIKTLRYTMYRVLYPVGFALELLTVDHVVPPQYKVAFFAAYGYIALNMYSNMSNLESKQYLVDCLSKQAGSGVTVEYNRTVYNVSNVDQIQKYNRYKLTKREDGSYLLKDYGLQISWRLVYILEYLGALVAYPYMVGELRLDVVLWTLHYTKRIFESIFVHKFSNDTMPLTNLFKNSAYYWGAGLLLGFHATFEHRSIDILYVCLWVLCQSGNMFCHVYLANLRKDGSREHVLPTNWLFRQVTCPNYTFEILGWLLFTLIGQQYVDLWKLAFCCVGAGQMYVWAGGKYRRYKKLFGDKYKVNRKL
jgi:very-long-chain enoyl-CoA reductase